MDINPDKITAYFRAHSNIRDIVHEVLLFDEVSSTNDIALEMAGNGMPEGLAILAESQTAGKGRQGRDWFSPSGKNIYMSLLLRPSVQMREYPLFSPIAALGVIKGIKTFTGLDVGIKWPNDLMLANKKVGGLLLVSGGAGGYAQPLVIGLGLNVNLNQDEFPKDLQGIATALKIPLKASIDRSTLIMKLIDAISAEIHRLENGEIQDIMHEVRTHCITLGKRVRVSTARQVFEGQAEGLSDDGALQIRLGDHSMRSILMGDITHLRETTGIHTSE